MTDEQTKAGAVLPKVVATAPERIWLQVCNEDDCEDCRDSEFPDSHECTWCADKIGGIEVEYVRADLSTPQPNAREIPPPEQAGSVPMTGKLSNVRRPSRFTTIDVVGGAGCKVSVEVAAPSPPQQEKGS